MPKPPDQSGATPSDSPPRDAASCPFHPGLATREPPAPKGWPLLANSWQLFSDPLGSLSRWYTGLGPVFKASYVGQQVVFISGPEARTLFTGEHDDLFKRDFFYVNLANELDSENLIFCAAGEEHKELRKLAALAFSRHIAASHLEQAVSDMQAWTAAQPPGGRRPLVDWCAEMALVGAWRMIFGDEPRDLSYQTVARYVRTIMRVSARLRPGMIYKLPGYSQAKKACLDSVRDKIRRRRTMDRSHATPDVLDCLLAEGGPNDREAAALALLAMLGSIVYLNRVTAFMLHHAYRDREMLAALRDEVDRAFALGLDNERLRSMPLLHGLYNETLRLHPVWFVVPLLAAKDFSFSGSRVHQGELLAISPVQEHFLAEHYTEPQRFDPFRCMPPRSEHRTPGAFNPYGLGNRKCVAFGIAEVLTLLTAAITLHQVEGSVPNAPPKVALDPLPGPRTRLRYTARRAPTQGRTSGAHLSETGTHMLSGSMAPGERAAFLERLSTVQDRVFQPGEIVLREGDAGEELFLVQSGTAEVSRTFGKEGEHHVATLGPGEVFGELALLRSARRSATVRAGDSTPLLVSVVGRGIYLDLVRECNLSGREIFDLVRQGRAVPVLNECFPQLCAEHRAVVLPLLETIDVAPGKVVVREGDGSDAMFLILDGNFEVVRGGQHVATLGPGQYFGEVGVLGGTKRNATVSAGVGAPAQLLRFPAKAVDRLLELDVVREAITDIVRQRAVS